MSAELEVPPFYDPAHARQHAFDPDQAALFAAARAWRREHDLRPAVLDRVRRHLLLIDAQRDFCFPEGSLYVGGRTGTGATEDNDRLARFVYRNLAWLSEITCTLDTHLPFQIFSSSFWLDAQGEPVAAHTTITTDDVRSGRVRPNPDVAAVIGAPDSAWLARQVEFYCRSLEQAGKYTLYLWPPHCLIGSTGHALAGVLHEARLFHAWARNAPNTVEPKGQLALSENYSVFAPEVQVDFEGRRLGARNDALVDLLLRADQIVIAGQAASHCVLSSVDDLIAAVRERNLLWLRRLYILRDGMSAVAVPDPGRPGEFLADFTPQAEAAFERWAEAGLNVVSCAAAIEGWPRA